MAEALRRAAGPGAAPAYVESLDAGAADKAALFARWIPADAAGPIVDLGCGPGGVAARLALARPACAVLGLDADPAMVAAARARHGGPANLAFRIGPADRPAATGAAVCLLSSVLHEVAAQGGPAAVARALHAAAASLGPGGRLIVRDFVRPADAARPVELRHARRDLQLGRGFADFAHGARFAVRLDGCRLEPDALCHGTDVEGAYEFALRKDSGDAWDAELGQRYAFWTEAEARRLVAATGLRLVHAAVVADRWTIEHRLRSRLELRDAASGRPLPLAAGKIVIVAERALKSA
jgi:SAM-dependent methyltransferase